MSEIQFANNYSDLSEETGARSGFQFEFTCARCSDTWRSNFTPFAPNQAAEWIGRAGGFLGNVLGGAGDAIGGVGEARWGTEHDKAFAAAIEQAKAHFHRCPSCVKYVCDRCWNAEAGLCLECAPNAAVAAEAAFAAGKVQAVGTETGGAKFCPSCGQADGG